MAGELNKAAEEFLSTDAGKKLAGRKDELQKLTRSSDGQQVRRMLEGRDIGAAISKGDTEVLKNTLSDIMNTEAGARLVKQLSELMGK